MYRQAQFNSKSKNKNKYKKLSCPNCKSENIIKRGFRQTQNRGKIQRFSCRNCKHRFVKDEGFYRMRNSPQKITLCLDLFFRGISTRKIQEHLQAFYPKNASWVSIYFWVIKYPKIISKFTDNLNLKVGREVQVDEMEYHRRKSHKAKLGIDKNWFIDGIDVKTRYMVNSAYVKHRSKEQLKKVLSGIKDKSTNIKIVQTDGLTAYDKIVKRNWGYDNKIGKYKIEHRVKTQSKGEGFNIWIERLHNTIRQRTQNFRGFHGSVESAYALMKGLEIYYNFIRKHEALKNKTPSELATDLEFKSPNRWLELIEMSNKN